MNEIITNFAEKMGKLINKSSVFLEFHKGIADSSEHSSFPPSQEKDLQDPFNQVGDDDNDFATDTVVE